MPNETPTLHRVARPTTPALIVIAVVTAVFLVAFTSGFWTSRLMDEGRVREQAEARFGEFLAVGIDLGFVTVDRQKLDEIACIASEADWEDREATERRQEPSPQSSCGRTGRQ